MSKAKKPEPRKRGEHRWRDYSADGGITRCVTCGCDEDDAFVGGRVCSYKQKPDWKPE